MGKQKTYDTAVVQERAILVGVVTPGEKEAQTKEYLDELAFLVETAGGITEKRFTQKMQTTSFQLTMTVRMKNWRFACWML